MGGTSDETAKTESPRNDRCGKIKIPPCSKESRKDVNLAALSRQLRCFIREKNPRAGRKNNQKKKKTKLKPRVRPGNVR